MKDQHTKITGYRDLSQDEIDMMNEGKALAVQVGEWLARLESGRPGWNADGRWLSIGKTDLQKGFMAAIRSIAKPETF